MRYYVVLAQIVMLSAGCQSASPVRAPVASKSEPTIESLTSQPGFPPRLEANTESNLGQTIERLPPVQRLSSNPSPSSPIQLVAHHQVAEEPESTKSNSVELVPSPLPVESQSQTCLTLSDLEAMALLQNPAVAEAAARVRALQGNYVQVGLPPNPTAGYTSSEIGDNGRAGQQGAYIGQQFITGGKLWLNRAVAFREVQRAQQWFAAAQQRVLTDVRVSFYEVLIAQQRLAVTEKLFDVGRQGVDAVEALLKAQEASRTDLLQSMIEASTAQMLIENARAARYGAWIRLAAVVGTPGLPLADVAGDAASGLPAIEFESALEEILAASPQLAAAYTEIERARWAVQRAQAQVVPNVTLQGTVQYDYGSEMTIAGAQVGLPLPIVNRNQGGIAQTQSELAAAQQAAARLELALQKKCATVYQRYQIARQQVDRYRSDILPQADENLRLTTEGYEAGEFSYLQLLTVQRTYFQTNLSYLDALGRMWTASREIEGLLLSGSLEVSSGEP